MPSLAARATRGSKPPRASAPPAIAPFRSNVARSNVCEAFSNSEPMRTLSSRIDGSTSAAMSTLSTRELNK